MDMMNRNLQGKQNKQLKPIALTSRRAYSIAWKVAELRDENLIVIEAEINYQN